MKAHLTSIGLTAAGCLVAILIAGMVKKQMDKAKTSLPASTASTPATNASTATA